MDVLTDDEINSLTSKSKLVAKYNQVIDSESAYEILTAKLKCSSGATTGRNKKKIKINNERRAFHFKKVANNTIVESMVRTAGNTIVRSLLGALGFGWSYNPKKNQDGFKIYKIGFPL